MKMKTTTATLTTTGTMDELWRRNEERGGRAKGRRRRRGGRGRAKYGSHFVLLISLVGLVCRVDGATTLNRKEYDKFLSCLYSSDSLMFGFGTQDMEMAKMTKQQ